LTAPADQASYNPSATATARGGRRRRRPRSPSLFGSRLKRALRRQGLLFVVFAAVIGAFGVLYEMAGGASLARAILPAAGIGAASAFLLVALREIGRNTITSLSSLGRHRGFSVLGAAPDLTTRALRELPPDQRSPLGCLAYQPASAFATAFRDLQGALAEERIVAVAAALPGEGATTTALCAAVSAAQQGRNVILIDCDLRQRSLTRGFGIEPDVGVLEACEHPGYWREYVEREGETGLQFIPAARPRSPWRSLADARGFGALLRTLSEEFDLVVLDCPPVLASADGQALARLADKCVLVALWDRTPLGAIRTAIRAMRARATGVFVNRVPEGYRFGRLRPD
jgi:Mrp family chromosome partitioning ATPase